MTPDDAHTKPASPWDVVMNAPPLRSPAPQRASDVREGTKTARLLAELANRSDATTRTLATCSDLSPQQVWGLLMRRRECGQVRYEAGKWSLVREHGRLGNEGKD